MRAHAVWLMVAAVTAAAPAQGQLKATRLPGAPAPNPPHESRANLGVIDGFVSDTNLVPLRGAYVTLPQVRVRIGTSPAGRFRIDSVAAGQYLVIVRRAGYRPTSEILNIAAGDTVRVSYTLERAVEETGAAHSLDPVMVEAKRQSAQMRDFEQRRKAGLGLFITADELKARGSTATSDALMAVPAMTVTPDQSNGGALIAMSRREGGGITSLGEPAYCPMLVLLNGVRLSLEFDLRMLPPPTDIAGIEIYSGAASIPAQFAGADSKCGVMLVWTKDGS